MIKNFLVHHLNHFNIRWENALCSATESHYVYKFLRCHFYSSPFQSNNHFSSHVMLHLFKQLTKTMGHYFLNLNVVLLKSLNLWCIARFGTFVQFKKCEKHPWRSVTVSPPWVFYMFFESRNASHLISDSIFAKSNITDVWLGVNYASRDDQQW